MTYPNTKTQFPDYFTAKGPIPLKVKPLRFGTKVYYKASIVTNDNDEDSTAKPRQLRPYLDNDEEMMNCADTEENYDIILTKSGKFQTSFYVPACVHSSIIGARGSRLKELQNATNTVIKVPRMNQKGDVIITGDTERKVASARTRIAMIVAQKRDRMRPTHFVSIPIDSETIRAKLSEFREAVLSDGGASRGVTDSLFQNPEKLHVTVVVMALLDDEEVGLARETLRRLYDEHISEVFPKGQRHLVRVRGLEIMNDDPTNVHVVYAKVQMDGLDKLQEVCDRIMIEFRRVGLAKHEYDRVKLHVTVMNSSFRTEGRSSFDATEILRKYADFEFGEFEFRQLDLCIRGTTTGNDGHPKYYDTASSISLA